MSVSTKILALWTTFAFLSTGDVVHSYPQYGGGCQTVSSCNYCTYGTTCTNQQPQPQYFTYQVTTYRVTCCPTQQQIIQQPYQPVQQPYQPIQQPYQPVQQPYQQTIQYTAINQPCGIPNTPYACTPGSTCCFVAYAGNSLGTCQTSCQNNGCGQRIPPGSWCGTAPNCCAPNAFCNQATGQCSCYGGFVRAQNQCGPTGGQIGFGK